MFLSRRRTNYPYVSSQEMIRDCSYRQYLLQGDKPKNRFSNTRNLFDDSNREDAKWLEIARLHMTLNQELRHAANNL